MVLYRSPEYRRYRYVAQRQKPTVLSAKSKFYHNNVWESKINLGVKRSTYYCNSNKAGRSPLLDMKRYTKNESHNS